MGDFALQIQTLFEWMFGRYLKRRLVRTHKSAFLNILSITWRQIKRLPFVRLFRSRWSAGEFTSIEVVVKDDLDAYIRESELQWLLIHAIGREDILHIWVTRSQVPKEMSKRLFDIFLEHNLFILILGEPEIERLRQWMQEDDNLACQLFLYTKLGEMLDHEDAWNKMGAFVVANKQELLERLLMVVKDFKGPLGTVLKKLECLIVFHEEACNIVRICDRIGITRRTFYNWYNNDKAFAALFGNHSDPGGAKSERYMASEWYQGKQTQRILKDLWDEVNRKKNIHVER
ncbi:hypothetical protein C4568_01585 [Candidatus Parcubacteria bacterium]|nr:MAG: hypothetical protein C4568_01585 [Candidatus Parcubacteria bacterium]